MSKKLSKTEIQLQKLKKLTAKEERVADKTIEKQRRTTKKLAKKYEEAQPCHGEREITNMKRKIQITQGMLEDINRMHARHAEIRNMPASVALKSETEQMLQDLHQMHGDMMMLDRDDYVVTAPGEEVVVTGGADWNSANASVTGYLNQAHSAINQLQTLHSQVLQGVHTAQSVYNANKYAINQVTSAAKSAANGISGVFQKMQ